MNNMPAIDLAKTALTGRDLVIAQSCLNKGHLRASKPKGDRNAMGETQYVWRMVAFMISPISQHQCMPMTAEFDLPNIYWDKPFQNTGASERRRARTKELDTIVDAMMHTVPMRQWHGVQRWGRALGAL